MENTLLEGELAKKHLKEILENPNNSPDNYNHPSGERKKGWWKENNKFCAFDNTTGHCNVEEFNSKGAMKKWLFQYK